MTQVPERLRPLTQFLQRAGEFDKRDAVVAYWCRFRAAQLGLEIHGQNKTDAEAKAFLMNLLDQLETAKKRLAAEEAVTNETVAAAHVEDYAMKLFTFADNQDRAGLADKKTAQAFVAASTLFETLKNFGELDVDIAERVKYAKFKSVDILKCLKAGVKPTPGPPGGDASMAGEDELGPGAARGGDPLAIDAGTSPRMPDASLSAPSAPIAAPRSAPSLGLAQPPPHGMVYAESARTSPVDAKDIQLAQKHCRWAASALDYEDVTTAMESLSKALDILQRVASRGARM